MTTVAGPIYEAEARSGRSGQEARGITRTRKTRRCADAGRVPTGGEGVLIFGFEKNERANISSDELRALKFLAKELLSYSAMSLTKALQTGELIEIEVNDDG